LKRIPLFSPAKGGTSEVRRKRREEKSDKRLSILLYEKRGRRNVPMGPGRGLCLRGWRGLFCFGGRRIVSPKNNYAKKKKVPLEVTMMRSKKKGRRTISKKL